jgi:hypothetical protein
MPVSGSGFEQTSNAQAGVDHGSRLIVENPVSQNPNDKQELQPALDNLSQLPPRLGQVEHRLADNGYCSEANVTTCEQATPPPAGHGSGDTPSHPGRTLCGPRRRP